MAGSPAGGLVEAILFVPALARDRARAVRTVAAARRQSPPARGGIREHPLGGFSVRLVMVVRKRPEGITEGWNVATEKRWEKKVKNEENYLASN
jgi:hypothetical protein